MLRVQRLLTAAILVVVGIAVAVHPVSAGVIEYEARDLADTVVGDDLWEYEYFLSGFGFGVDDGFSIYAPEDSFRDLVIPAAPGADWDATAVEPDPVLGSAGWYDGLSLVSGPSLLGPFVMRFVWLGGPKGPGAQAFEVYALDPQGGLTVIDEGRTARRSVPEPSTVGLLALAALGAASGLRRRRRRT